MNSQHDRTVMRNRRVRRYNELTASLRERIVQLNGVYLQMRADMFAECTCRLTRHIGFQTDMYPSRLAEKVTGMVSSAAEKTHPWLDLNALRYTVQVPGVGEMTRDGDFFLLSAHDVFKSMNHWLNHRNSAYTAMVTTDIRFRGGAPRRCTVSLELNERELVYGKIALPPLDHEIQSLIPTDSRRTCGNS